jgi:putative transposase
VAEGFIRLKYLDEMGKDGESMVTYTWMHSGEQKCIPQPKKLAPRQSILGIWEPDKDFKYALIERNFTSEEYLKIMEEEARDAWKHFLATGQPTVIVQDNCSIHKSNRVKLYWKLWARQALHMFFNAPHSPQQNRIEGEWLHVKYGELRGKSFSEASELEKALVEAIESRFGDRGHSVKRYTV